MCFFSGQDTSGAKGIQGQTLVPNFALVSEALIVDNERMSMRSQHRYTANCCIGEALLKDESNFSFQIPLNLASWGVRSAHARY